MGWALARPGFLLWLFSTDSMTGKGKSDGTATLVHCRVGVSRSASICIAEVMASQGLSFPRA
jgi:dual specificity MAP kinase phosphatase